MERGHVLDENRLQSLRITMVSAKPREIVLTGTILIGGKAMSINETILTLRSINCISSHFVTVLPCWIPYQLLS